MNDTVALLSGGCRVSHLCLSLGSALLFSPSKLAASDISFLLFLLSLGFHTVLPRPGMLQVPQVYKELQSPSPPAFFSLTSVLSPHAKCG